MHKNTASENPHACDVQRNAEKVKFILKLLSLAVVRGQLEKEKGRMLAARWPKSITWGFNLELRNRLG